MLGGDLVLRFRLCFLFCLRLVHRIDHGGRVVVDAVEEVVEFGYPRSLCGSTACLDRGCLRGGCRRRRRREIRIHLCREVDDRLAADVDADVPAHEGAHVGQRFVGIGVRAASRYRKCALQEPLQTRGERGTATDLSDLDDLHQQGWQRFGIFIRPKIASEHERDGAERELGDVSRGVEVDEAVALWRGDAEPGPQPLARQAHPFDSGAKRRIEKHNLSVGREHGAGDVEEAVCDANGSVEEGERRQAIQEITESDVNAWNDRGIGRRVEEIRQARAIHELGEDDELTGVGVALDVRLARKALVIHAREARNSLTNQRLECGNLGLNAEALQHLSGFPVERRRSAPEAINVAA